MRRQKNTFAVQVNGETVHECTLADAAWRVARMYEARGERVRILMNGELCAAGCDCGAVLKGAAA